MSKRQPTPLLSHRLKNGLTQAEVAAAAGITSRHYQSVERYRVIPGVSVALRIAIILRSSVEVLWKEAVE